ncbi:MAG TPA: manganese efflux pump MntP family protein [Candidatus Brocadiia bacterium]|nr:manganese efflux pump MntP family protein [Candidatus Brocadiia bacterium]
MDLIQITAISAGLAMDSFAVSIVAGVTVEEMDHRDAARMGFHFGLFQWLMPIVGWFAGRGMEGIISRWDHWVAFGLLTFIGVKMILESGDLGKERADVTRGVALLTLAIATSIDALAVGLSFALLGVSIWLPSALAGGITFTVCVLGASFGKRLGRSFGRKMEIVGGLVLVGIGLKILAEHMGW